MKKVKLAVTLVIILMISALVSAYKQGDKAVKYKEFTDPLSAINYLIEVEHKGDTKAALEVMTEKYQYINDTGYISEALNLQYVAISDITESKDEKLVEVYKKSSSFNTKNVEEIKIYKSTETFGGGSKYEKRIRCFVVVRLKGSTGWLIDSFGYNQQLENELNSK